MKTDIILKELYKDQPSPTGETGTLSVHWLDLTPDMIREAVLTTAERAIDRACYIRFGKSYTQMVAEKTAHDVYLKGGPHP